MAACSIEQCSKPVYRRGMCGAHYGRLHRYGSPTAGGAFIEQKASSAEIDEFLSSACQSDQDGCILWPFAVFKSSGYGQVMVGGSRGAGALRPCGAHVYVCEVVHGMRPFKGAEVAHGCGNRLCVNPVHLRWATRKQNMDDKISHGTMPFGEKNGSARLTQEDVDAIRNLKGTISQRETAKRFGVGKTTIAHVLNGHTWASPPPSSKGI